MFAAGMLWVKNVLKLNNKITGLICFAHSGSVQVYSLVTGMMEEHPAWCTTCQALWSASLPAIMYLSGLFACLKLSCPFLFPIGWLLLVRTNQRPSYKSPLVSCQTGTIISLTLNLVKL